MSTLLSPETTAPTRPVPSTGGPRRWLRSWRVSLRLARRDAWRDKWRSLLVVVLILTPVTAIAGIDVFARTIQAANTDSNRALLSLGTVADAMVISTGTTAVVQSPDGSLDPGVSGVSDPGTPGPVVEGSSGPRPNRPAFPASWHTVGMTLQYATLLSGKRGWQGEVTATDTRDPLAAGTFIVSSGVLPSAPGEVAISTALATESGLSIGDTATVVSQSADTKGAQPPRVEMRVVGVADPTNEVGLESMVLLPGQVPAPGGVTKWLVKTPTPLTWADVRAANAHGLVVQSREVLTNPPDFCSPNQFCLDDGPAAPAASSGSLLAGQRPEDLARTAALGVMLAALALMEVALLAGPAFAVSLRRRQRDLALVAANGGTGSDLRRSILASAVVLGIVAGAAGVGLAVVAVAFLSSRVASLRGHVPLPAPVVMPEVIAIAAIGVIAAIAAAAVPARIAGRTDVLHALRGRRPSGPVKRRTTWAGVALVVLGGLLLVWGTVNIDAVVLTAGILISQTGIILVVPWLVTVVGRVGTHLPVMLRLATRDSARSRLRTVSAVCAICAAAAGASVALIATSSYSAGKAAMYHAQTLPNTMLVSVYGDPKTAAQVGKALRTLGNGSVTSAAINPTVARPADDSYTASGIVLHIPGCSLTPTSDGAFFSATGKPFEPLGSKSEYTGPPTTTTFDACTITNDLFDTADYYVPEVIRADSAWLAATTGINDPVAARTLDSGGAVVFDPTRLGPNGVTLTTVRGNPQVMTGTISVPGILAVTPGASPIVPARVIVGPNTPVPSGWTFADTTFTITPAVGADVDELESRARGLVDQVVPNDGSGSVTGVVYVERGYADSTRPIQLIAVGATSLLALIAGLAVTALALSDARPDLATMAAVGAPPRSRRRYAAAIALVVAGLGTWLGIAAGVVPAWATTRTISVTYAADQRVLASDSFTIPWMPLLLLGIAVPLVTAAVAYVFTRGSVSLTRRAD